MRVYPLGTLIVLGVLTASSAGAQSQKLETRAWEFDGCNLFWKGKVIKTEKRCYTDWKWRSASPLSVCPGQDRSGLLCYPACAEGYDGVGPVCWQKCPPGYTDDGAFCRRNVRIIGANNDRCPGYDKCGLTFERGCSTCPPGYQNDGCTCRIDAHIFAKDTYTRGIGEPMSCAQGKVQIGALCYGPCPSGYKANGVYCEALQETCMDVPIEEPAPPLEPFCFELLDSKSWVQPCLPVKVYADTEEHAKRIAQCQCVNCEVRKLPNCEWSRACGK